MNRRKRSRVNPEGYSDKYDPRPRATITFFGTTPPKSEIMERYIAQSALYTEFLEHPSIFEQKRPLVHQDDGWRDIGTVAHEQAEIWTKER